MTSPQPGPEPASEPAPDRGPASAGNPGPPEQAAEDTDIAWGDYREPDDDRLSRDRPPHWAEY